ncbi:unnamed protein product [Alopecurus aequalis]
MATRPTPGSRDGSSNSSTRGRSTSGGRPTSSNPRPATSDAASRRPARASLSPAPSSEKPVPSFLRPTVSSSLRSTSPSPIPRPSSSKGSPSPAQSPAAGSGTRPITPKRSRAQQPASSPLPLPPKRSPVQPVSAPRAIAPAMDKGKAKSASTSRWSVASPRVLMQKASNALKTGKMRSKKNKDLAGPAASAVASINKEASGGASGGQIKAETARALPLEVQPHHPSGTIVEAPLDVQADLVAEPKAKQKEATSGEVVSDHVKTEKEQVITEVSRGDAEKGKAVVEEEATLEEVVSSTSTDHVKTEEERGQEEQVITEEPRGDAEKGKAVVEETVVPEESVEAVKVDTPVAEEKPQTVAVEEASEKEAEKNTEDELPPAAVVVVEEAAKEPAAPVNVQDEPTTSTAEEEVVVEINAAERQQEESPKPEEITEHSDKSVMSEEKITENSEKSVMPEEITENSEKIVTIVEEPKEQPAAATEKQQDEVADVEPKMIAASRASSLPATSLEEALEEMDATTKAQASTSRSEPVSPAKEAISKDKVVIDTLLSASAPTTPMKRDVQKGVAMSSPLMAKIPEEMRFSFKGSKVKTAMEKRPEEEQPKKKEVARSNDVLEEAKSKLLEKKKSKVGALVGAFETVMDSPRVSSTSAAKSRPTPR